MTFLNQTLLDMAQRAFAGEGGLEARQALSIIMNALLLNQSVYLPLTHLMIPLEWNGRMMFSELWIDPDADNSQRDGEKENAHSSVIKFDIQDLGLFHTVIELHGSKNVDLRIAIRGCSVPKGDSVKRQQNFEQMWFEVQKCDCGVPMRQPVGLWETFPRLYERKNSVNVSI